MARIQKPPAGRLIISIIYSSMDALADSLKALERKFSRVECETIEIPCSSKDRYREEMGENLKRRIFSFEKPVNRDTLSDIKNTCANIEPMFADCIRDFNFRTVNIDPGILTPDKLVMASHREYNHRIYLRDGVFAQIELIYSGGQFMQLPWTNPDFCDPEAIDLFYRVRGSFELVDDKYEIAYGDSGETGLAY